LYSLVKIGVWRDSTAFSTAAKNEGEPLHIVSPSTIPLTLGEEMAVLVLPLKSLLALASDRNKENPASNIGLGPQFLST